MIRFIIALNAFRTISLFYPQKRVTRLARRPFERAPFTRTCVLWGGQTHFALRLTNTLNPSAPSTWSWSQKQQPRPILKYPNGFTLYIMCWMRMNLFWVWHPQPVRKELLTFMGCVKCVALHTHKEIRVSPTQTRGMNSPLLWMVVYKYKGGTHKCY